MRKFVWLLLLVLLARADASPRFVAQAGHEQGVEQLSLSPDGKNLASLSKDSLRVWTRGGALRWSAQLSGETSTLAWSVDGTRIATAYGGVAGFMSARSETAGVVEFSALDGALLRRLPFGNNTIGGLRYEANGDLKASSPDGVVRFDASSKRFAVENETGATPPPIEEFSPDRKWLVRLVKPATDGAEAKWQLFEAQTNTLKATLPFLGQSAWSKDSRQFATFDGQRLWTWNASNDKSRVFAFSFLKPHDENGERFSFALAPDGQSAICARTDYPQQTTDPSSGLPVLNAPRAFVWRVDLGSGAIAALQNGTKRAIFDFAFWPDNTLIVGGSQFVSSGWSDGELFFARPQNESFNAFWRAPLPLGAVFQLAVSRDGTRLASAGGDTAIRLWNTRSGTLEKSLKTFSGELFALGLSPDGTRAAALDYESLFLFDTATGAAKTFKGLDSFSETGNSVEWSPDGAEVAFSTGSGAKILDIKSQTLRAAPQLRCPLHWTKAGVWCQNSNGGLELRDAHTLKIIGRLDASGVGSESPGDAVSAFEFVPGSDTLWTLAISRESIEDAMSVKQWSVRGNRVEKTISDFQGPVCLGASPDGKHFALGSTNGAVAVYDLSSGSKVWTSETGVRVNDLKWSGDATRVFAAGQDGQTRVLNAQSGALESTLVILPARTSDSTSYEWLRFSPDGRFAASPNAARQVRVFDGERAFAPGEDETQPLGELPMGKGPVVAPETSVEVAPTKVAPAPIPTPTPSGPTLVLQGDNTSQFKTLAVSNGGKWLAASSEATGEALQLWDGQNALQWSNWPLTSGNEPLCFTPDAMRLLLHQTDYDDDAQSAQGMINVCAVPSGKVLRRFALEEDALWCDNTRLRVVQNGFLLDYDLASGKQLSKRAIQNAPREERDAKPRFAFSRGGAFLVEGSRGTIRWWRAGDGHLLGQIKDPLRAIGKTAISDDGLRLASEGDDPGWSPPTEASSEAAYARQFNLHVWNTASKKLLHTFPGYGSLDGGARLLEWGRDGKTLLGSGGAGLDRFSLATAKNAPLPLARADFRQNLSWPLGLSSDGAWMSGAGQIYQSSEFGPGLQLWSLATSKLTAHFAGTLRGAQKLAWSPDGKFLAGGGLHLLLWDARTGALLAERPDTYAEDLSWTVENTLQTQNLGETQLWHAPDLKPLVGGFDPRANTPASPKPKVEGMTDGMSEVLDQYSNGLSVSPDRKTIVTTDVKGFGSGQALWAWNAATRKVTRKIALPDKDHWGYSEMERLVWIDNARVAFGTTKGFRVLNLETGIYEPEQRDPTDPTFKASVGQNAMVPLAASGDGAFLAVQTARDATVSIYNARTGKWLRRLPVKVPFLFRGQFLRDNQTLLVQTQSGLEWWNVANQSSKPEHVFTNVPSGDWTLSPDETRLAFSATATSSNGVSMWNAQNGRELARLYLLGGDSQHTSRDWIALTPDGFYNASPEGEKRLRWREGNAFWSLERSRAAFKRPEKVQEALR